MISILEGIPRSVPVACHDVEKAMASDSRLAKTIKRLLTTGVTVFIHLTAH